MRLPQPARERGSVAVGLLRTALALGLPLVALADAGSIALTTVRLDAAAATAARDAVGVVSGVGGNGPLRTPTVQAAYGAAVRALSGTGGTIDPATFQVRPDRSVSFTASREAPTLVLARIGPLHDWAVARVDTTAAPPRI